MSTLIEIEGADGAPEGEKDKDAKAKLKAKLKEFMDATSSLLKVQKSRGGASAASSASAKPATGDPQATPSAQPPRQHATGGRVCRPGGDALTSESRSPSLLAIRICVYALYV